MNKRNTIQKKLVWDTVNQMFCHPTAEEVYQQLRLSCPGISKATVYRNLGSLARDGQVLKIGVPNAADRYDRTAKEHYHAVCRRCGRLFDIAAESPPVVASGADENREFFVEECFVLFRGLCRDCRERQKDVFQNHLNRSKGEKV